MKQKVFLGQHNCRADGPVFQNTMTFNPDSINYRRFGFLKLDNAVSLLQKKTFFTVY